jgi:uncharacterized protein
MNVWAIADLHLAFSVPQKNMDVFGGSWIGYADKIEKNWRATVGPDDLVLVAGDISWATSLQDAKVDLDWVEALPGTKVMVKGNHDYWWSSLTKVRQILPPSLHLIQNNAFVFDDIAIAGARLWDTDAYNFNAYIDFKSTPLVRSKKEILDQEKIFKRELARLEMSLKALPAHLTLRFAMTHYPPIGSDLQPSLASCLFEKYRITHCVFGHLHNVKKDLLFGPSGGVVYSLTSCDSLNFYPLKIYSSAK